MGKKYTALVLQGGGALGAYEYGVIKALYEQQGFSPDIISGVSIGAFSAAVLVGSKGNPVQSLEHMWEFFTAKNIPFVPQPAQELLSLPFNRGMYSPNPYAFLSPTLVTHYFDTKRLYSTLEKLIDLDKLNDNKSPHLIITATNIETGELEIFDNRKMDITLEHIVASGSLPPSFPMTDIEGTQYWDGGLFSNTPFKPAMKLLEQKGDKNSEREIIIIELFPKKGKVPNNMTDVLDRMLNLSFENKMRYESDRYEKTNNLVDLIQALDKDLPKDSPFRHMLGFKQLMNYNKIHQFTVIRNTSEAPLYGGADFTEKTITNRIEQGYKDAKLSIA